MKKTRRYIIEQVAAGNLSKERAAEMLLELYECEPISNTERINPGSKRAESLDTEHSGGTNQSGPEEKIEITPQKDFYPMLPAQKMILLHQFMRKDTAYNIPRVLYLEGEIEKEKLSHVFKTIVQRHHALRTSFCLLHGEYVQKINDTVEFEMESVTGREEDIEEDIRDFVRCFQLDKAPLFRVRLISYSKQRHALLMDIHHIISDRQSIVILMNEFQLLYQGKVLPEIDIHYEHYVEWYYKFLESDMGKREEEFWLGQFGDGGMASELKTDFPRKYIRKYTEKSLHYEFEDEDRDRLLYFCTQKGVTLNMLMLSVYHVLLWKWLGKKDLVTGVSCQGRTRKELYNMIGMFVNTLAIRNYPSGEKRFIDFLNETKEILLNVYSNQEYPFDVLTDKLRHKLKEKDKGLINTLFIMQNTDYLDIELGQVKARPYHDYIEVDSRFDLQVNVFNSSDKHLNICFIYSKELFMEESIGMLLHEYVSILKQAMEAPEQLLSNFDSNL